MLRAGQQRTASIEVIATRCGRSLLPELHLWVAIWNSPHRSLEGGLGVARSTASDLQVATTMRRLAMSATDS